MTPTPEERADQVDLRFTPNYAEWSAFLPIQRKQIADEIRSAQIEQRDRDARRVRKHGDLMGGGYAKDGPFYQLAKEIESQEI